MARTQRPEPTLISMPDSSAPRIAIRKPATTDIETLFRIYGDPRTNTFNPAGPLKSIADAEATLARWLSHWRENGFGLWAVALVDNPDEVIGFGGLSYAQLGDQVRVHVGYRFAAEAWGRGYATELTRFAIDHGFRALGLAEIFAFVRPAHSSSRKVLEKAGMTECGLLDDVPGSAPSILYYIKDR